MTKVLLIRHCRSTANADGVLTGRMPGVALDDRGREQALRLRDVLARVSLAASYTSPIERCRETAELAGLSQAEVEAGLSECDYGEWSGRSLADLAREPLWERVQGHPGAVRFPSGESMLEMRDRVTRAVRAIAARHDAGEVVAVVSHGDPIKAVLADALGLDFDLFQRIDVGPASVSLIDYSNPERPVFQLINGGSDLAGMLAALHRPTLGGGDLPAPDQG